MAMLVMSLSGAITALGDTLFPPQDHGDVLRLALDSTQHLFIQLRIYHPFIAVLLSVYIICALRILVLNQKGFSHALAVAIVALLCIQIVLGYMNVWFMAPITLQLVHLFMSQIIWMCLVSHSFFIGYAFSCNRDNSHEQSLVQHSLQESIEMEGF